MRLARFFILSAVDGTLTGAAIELLGIGDAFPDGKLEGGAEEGFDGVAGIRAWLEVVPCIASVAVAMRSSSSSLHLRAPGQDPSQLSRKPRQLFASSIAVRDAPTSRVCIAYSKMMTAELNSVWIKNAMW